MHAAAVETLKDERAVAVALDPRSGVTDCSARSAVQARGPRKRVKVRAALLARARDHFEADATALDYVCDWVSEGRTVLQLANAVAEDIQESCSRSFLSLIIHRLAPDATERIAAARRSGADALVEKALGLASTPCSADEAPLRKLHIDGLLWQAARMNPGRYGAEKRTITLNLGR